MGDDAVKGDGGSEEVIEKRFCSNCQSHIPIPNFTVHEIHCARNVTLCKPCNVGVSKSSWEDHQALYHTETPCDKCGQPTLPLKKLDHDTNHCPNRPVQCEICEIEVFHKDFSIHDTYCKSRTEYCPGCRNYVKVIEMETHDCKPPAAPPISRARSSETHTEVNLDELDAESRLALDLTLQEVYAAREAALLAAERGSGDFAGASSVPQEADPTLSNGTDTCVPCELCGSSINFQLYNEHLQRCSRMLSTPLPPADVAAPPGSSSDITGTKRKTAVKPKRSPVPAATRMNTETNAASSLLDTTSTVPCEFCREMVNFALYADHVAKCEEDLIRSTQSSRDTQKATSSTRIDNGPHPMASSGLPLASTTPPKSVSEDVDQSLVETSSQVPCDICGKPINFNHYQKHTDECAKIESDRIRQGNELDDQPQSSGTSVDSTSMIETNAQVPCELCEQMVNFIDFQTHMTQCAHQLEDVTRGTALHDQDDRTLCDHCGIFVDVGEFKKHKQRCFDTVEASKSRPTRARNTNRTQTCYDCLKDIPFDDYPAHVRHCKSTESLQSRPDQAVERTFTMLPCEFCEESFPSDQLEHHQILCPKNEALATRSTRRLSSDLTPLTTKTESQYDTTSKFLSKYSPSSSRGSNEIRSSRYSRSSSVGTRNFDFEYRSESRDKLERTLNCSTCGKKISYGDYGKHVVDCEPRDRARLSNAASTEPRVPGLYDSSKYSPRADLYKEPLTDYRNLSTSINSLDTSRRKDISKNSFLTDPGNRRISQVSSTKPTDSSLRETNRPPIIAGSSRLGTNGAIDKPSDRIRARVTTDTTAPCSSVSSLNGRIGSGGGAGSRISPSISSVKPSVTGSKPTSTTSKYVPSSVSSGRNQVSSVAAKGTSVPRSTAGSSTRTTAGTPSSYTTTTSSGRPFGGSAASRNIAAPTSGASRSTTTYSATGARKPTGVSTYTSRK